MLLAHEGGYEAVQMRAVAEKADVALGTIYRYFSGKDELLIAGLAEWIRLLRRRVVTELPQCDSPAERLSSVLSQSAQSTDNVPVLMSALVTALSTTDPAAAEYKMAVEREIRGLVEWAIHDTEGIDADGVARILGHVWFSAITRWVGGLAGDGSVATELRHGAYMLLGDVADAD